MKNLTGAETTVSTFKPKHRKEEESSASEISDEEIEMMQKRYRLNHKMRQDSKNSMFSENSVQSAHSVHRTVSQRSDQWSIRSDMEYRHNGLKNTVSADSRSSLWSNLPLPLETIDIERDNLDEIIDQLPGMANSLDDRKNPSITELLSAKDRIRHARQYWQSDGPGTRTFELVDYYDELQGKYVKKLLPVQSLHRTSSGTQVMGTPVHRTFSGTQVLHRTTSGLQEIMEGTEEEEDHSHGENRVQKIKPRLLTQDNSMQKESKSRSPKRRSKSAKNYQAPKPPMSEEAKREASLEREENEKVRSKARNKLMRKLSSKGGVPPLLPLQRTSSRRDSTDVKVASVRKLQVQSKEVNDNENQRDTGYNEQEHMSSPKECEGEKEGGGRLYVQANRKESAERKFPPEKLSQLEVKRYSSFSSNDSSSSLGSSLRERRADVSLTSGELTSISSQADADTDELMTDAELSAKEAFLRNIIRQKKGVSDSGFDSESDMSSDVHGHHSSFYMSDDSAFHDGIHNRMHTKKLNKLQKSGPMSKVSISSDVHLPEKAFCVTGINSGVTNDMFALKSDSPELEVEYLPEKDIPPVHDDYLEPRPQSSMSRIIEVSSAAPDQTKSIEQEEEMRGLFTKSTESEYKSIAGRPKTPSSLSRPKTPSVMRGPNVMASNPIDASRRYRELVKKGVPLRVSEISAADNEQKKAEVNNEDFDEKEMEVNPEDEKLFNTLESEGFFKTQKDKNKPSPGRTYSTGNRKSRKDQARGERKRKAKANRLALDDIIREIPEEMSTSPARKSPGQNHLSPTHVSTNNLDDSFNASENDVAMINQPSEESETASVQNSSVANSVPPTLIPSNQPAVVVDAELQIDRIYSQNQKTQETKNQPPQLLDPDFDSPLLAINNGKLLRTMSDFPMQGLSPLDEPLDPEIPCDVNVPLLSGMNPGHVDKCRRLTSSLHLLSFNDLLPATHEGLEMMKAKLFQGGQLGTIGSQVCTMFKVCSYYTNTLTKGISQSKLICNTKDLMHCHYCTRNRAAW